MKLREYVEYLINGEISKLAIANVGDLSANPLVEPTPLQIANQKKIIGYINLANIALHRKFQLLHKDFELWNPIENEEYDLPKDFMQPLSAYYDVDKEPVSIKDYTKKLNDNIDTHVSLLFLDPFRIQIKGNDSLKRNLIILKYIASPTQVTNLSTDLKLPAAYTEALLNYAACKAHVAVSATMQDENNTYYLRYINSCKEIVESGLHGNNEIDSFTKLEDRGFV